MTPACFYFYLALRRKTRLSVELEEQRALGGGCRRNLWKPGVAGAWCGPGTSFPLAQSQPKGAEA